VVGTQPVFWTVTPAACHTPVHCNFKPGFHPNAIACVACVAFGWKPGVTLDAFYDSLQLQRDYTQLLDTILPITLKKLAISNSNQNQIKFINLHAKALHHRSSGLPAIEHT